MECNKEENVKSGICKAGIQLYTVRDMMDVDFYGTLAKVAEIGFKAVEFVKTYGLPAYEIRKNIDMLGLTSIGCFAGPGTLRENLDGIIADNLELGSSYIVCPYATFKSEQSYKELAAFFNVCGRTIRNSGLYLCYHHHEHEFIKFNNKTGLDILMDNSDPEFLKIELDTANMMAVGIEPVTLMRKYSGRCPIIHLKDHREGVKRGSLDLGKGDLDIEKIYKVVLETGISWVVFEQEYCSRPSIESARTGYQVMKNIINC